MENEELFDPSDLFNTEAFQWDFDLGQDYLQLELPNLPTLQTNNNTVNDSLNFTPQWNPGPTETPQLQPGPFTDPILHHMVQEQGINTHHASSSSHHGGLESGSHKRKSPSVPIPPNYRNTHSLNIRNEDNTQRNVRSRGVNVNDFEPNLSGPGSHLSNPTGRASSGPISIPNFQTGPSVWSSLSPFTREWNNNPVIPTTHSRTVVSETNPSSHGMNLFNIVSNITSSPSAPPPPQIGGSHNDYTPRHATNISHPPVRAVRTIHHHHHHHTHRPGPLSGPSGPIATTGPSFRASSSSNLLVPGQEIAPRYSRLIIRDRARQNRLSQVALREGLVNMDRSAIARALIDQHRNMSLDVDNMSYEELLALGDRIGNVNTGLSDSLIAKCLTESIYCSSDQALEEGEGKCVICLEEYEHMDDVATFKICRHDFHVTCVRKWLSIKNMCPICKRAAIDDKTKHN